MFKAVMFAERILEKPEETLKSAIEKASRYYQVDPEQTAQFVNPELRPYDTYVCEQPLAYDEPPFKKEVKETLPELNPAVDYDDFI